MTEEKKVPDLRFPGFTDPWEQRKLEIRQQLKMKIHCFLVPLMECISTLNCLVILEVHQILDI